MRKQIIATVVVAGVLLAAGAVTLGISTLNKRGPAPRSVDSSTVSSQAGAGNVQVSDGGGVQIQVTHDPHQVTDGTMVFQVALTTHSVELGQFDLGRLGRVIVEPGGVLAGAVWKPEGSGGGHHVSGTLTFKDPNGLGARARAITLEIDDVAGVPVRTFRWQIR